MATKLIELIAEAGIGAKVGDSVGDRVRIGA